MIKMMRLTMGEKIALLRQKAGNTEEELAAHMKMTVDAYTKLEEDFTYPSDQQIVRIGKFYGLSYEEVIAVGEDL